MLTRANEVYYRINENYRKRNTDNNHKNSLNKTTEDNYMGVKFPINNLITIKETIDLNKEFIEKPKESFLIRVEGDSMSGAGIESGDTLMVDRSIKPVHGSVVVASINGKLVVKKLHYSFNETMLMSENIDYMPIFIKPEDNLEIWGVAKLVIKSVKKI